MIKHIIQIILFSSLIYGCNTIKSYDNAIYENSRNGHKIELLESKKFIYTSYDGMQGVYYSYGDCGLNG
jgi:hypothetical protein